MGGYTKSENFPTTTGAFDPTYNYTEGPHYSDGIVFILSPELDSLIASTHLGGYNSDDIRSVIIDQDNRIVVAGISNSDDFPVTSGTFDTHLDAHPIVISRLTEDLSALLMSTYVEGTNGYLEIHQIVEEPDGKFVIVAHTNSTDFPTTPGAYDDTMHGDMDLLLFRMTSDLSDLVHGTFIGGSRYDYAAGLAVDTDGTIVVLGDSASPDFPTTLGTFDPTFNAHPVFSYPDLVVFRMSYDLMYRPRLFGQTFDHQAAVSKL